MVVIIYYYICYKDKVTTWCLNGFPRVVVTLGQQYNVGEKPTVILYTYINRHAEPPANITKHKNNTVVPSNHTRLCIYSLCNSILLPPCVMVYYIVSGVLLMFFWCPCMAINVSVQYNGGLLPDIILLTQYYFHRGTRLNAMKRFCICSF